MEQEGIGQPGRPLAGRLIGVGDWLFAQVATGHHQRLGEAGRARQQQMVERRIGQHDADGALARGHFGGDGGVGAAVDDDDRPRPREE